ncbi:MAG: hypothetical protein ACJ76J_10785 [Thermoanaerobaculia bacterium]
MPAFRQFLRTCRRDASGPRENAICRFYGDNGLASSYRKARGTVTVLILPNVPDGTDAVLTVDLR